MPLPSSTAELYDLLAGDAVLAPLLGEYRYPDGTRLPALARLWRVQAMPQGVTVEGLEVIVQRQASVSSRPWATGEIQTPLEFSVSLILWEAPRDGQAVPSLEDVIEEARIRILALLPGATASDVAVDGLTMGLAQYMIRWVNPAVVIPAPEA